MRQALTRITKALQKEKEGEKEIAKKSFLLPADFLAFQGHFPKQAVLPGIVQVLMAQMTLEELLDSPCLLEEIVQAKFSAPILPEQEVLVKVFCLRENLWQCEILINSDADTAKLAGSMRLKIKDRAI